jgi:predicted RNase H-like nuclease (RuvC/YqgF family)
VEGFQDVNYLQRRVKELEEKVVQLRLSRRVLMNLLERLEKEKLQYGARMERENKKLHQDNYRYARRLLYKNKRIVELEAQLDRYTSKSSANR